MAMELIIMQCEPGFESAVRTETENTGEPFDVRAPKLNGNPRQPLKGGSMERYTEIDFARNCISWTDEQRKSHCLAADGTRVIPMMHNKPLSEQRCVCLCSLLARLSRLLLGS